MSERLPRVLFAISKQYICIICHKPVSSLRATAGSLKADGDQAFACTAHFRNRRQWLLAWADWEERQRRISNNIVRVTQ